MHSSLLFPSLFFFLAVPLLVRSFAFPLGMVVLKGDLVEEEEVTVGSLLGAKTGAGGEEGRLLQQEKAPEERAEIKEKL